MMDFVIFYILCGALGATCQWAGANEAGRRHIKNKPAEFCAIWLFWLPHYLMMAYGSMKGYTDEK